MQLRRVVITGMGSVSPFGRGVTALTDGIEAGRSAVRKMAGWDHYIGLRSQVGAPAELKDEKLIPRQSRRSMGRLSLFAVQAAQDAVDDSGLDPALATTGRMGCVVGSTTGSAISISQAFETMLPDHDLTKLSSMQFFHCISHTATMNVAQYLKLNGWVMATSAACASAMHAMGTGYDLIRLGRQDVMLCGGAEELHPTVTGSFDVLFATSVKYNDTPHLTPRPFDRDRDGLVCGEGAGILMLEEYEHAIKRNARIYAEVIGYHTCSSGDHVSESSRPAMVTCMRESLQEAGVEAGQVDYVNAHATATLQGDKEEAEAIHDVFGDKVPVSSLKGYIGHTLGASAAIELAASLAGIRKGVLYPTLNLQNISPECQGVNHVMGTALQREARIIVKNSFAFGGISAVLVCRVMADGK
ncbi:MAG: beta-ketoacyl synthase N-terminal-like domain-containing protein [bacterium]